MMVDFDTKLARLTGEIEKLREEIENLTDECEVEDLLLNGPGELEPKEH